jgi:beta-fructofuranosidase
MYSGRGFRTWEIGDIEVIQHDGVFHLFHLILPNHDYIAHAISKDGISWERVKNALHTSEPGEWDDDMLWTMSIQRGVKDKFTMFYTGLSLAEEGRIQRIGKAVSQDLYHWSKCEEACWPVESGAPYYETAHKNDRGWVSFRDPYLINEGDQQYLLVSARSPAGPVSRRGCVGMVELNDTAHKLLPPLFSPHMYDDVECPCLININNRYYLLGSIREDIKVHYWFADEFLGPYRSYHDNVLMPQGNYAARIQFDGENHLVWSFYIAGHNIETSSRFLPPPKELQVLPDGRLALKSFSGWNDKVNATHYLFADKGWTGLFKNSTGLFNATKMGFEFETYSGYEVFVSKQPAASFRLSGHLRVVGKGKMGLVFDLDQEGSGYYISLDAKQGLCQIRAWGYNESDMFNNFIYNNLQSHLFTPSPTMDYSFELIRYQNYIEFSIGGEVTLSLVNEAYHNQYFGFYCESARVIAYDLKIDVLEEPS